MSNDYITLVPSARQGESTVSAVISRKGNRPSHAVFDDGLSKTGAVDQGPSPPPPVRLSWPVGDHLICTPATADAMAICRYVWISELSPPPSDHMLRKKTATSAKTYVISLANRKARGSGHERLGEILAAARTLFLEHGFENVSTRKIAEHVGVSQTTLFAYYKTKDDILAKLIQDAFAELNGAIAEVDRTARNPEDWLRRGIAGYIAFGLSHPDEYRLAFMVIKAYRRPYNAEQPERPGEGTRVGVPIFLRLVEKVDEAIKAGAIRRNLGSPMLVAQALWASMHGLVAALIARPQPHFPWEDVTDLIQVQTNMLLNGMLARRPKISTGSE